MLSVYLAKEEGLCEESVDISDDIILFKVLSVYLAKEEGLCEDSVDISGDIVLDAGIENFGFEHVKL